MKALPLALLLAAALSAPVAALAYGGTQGNYGTTASPQLQLDTGKKWSTDAPLRQSMDGIRAATAQLLPAVHANTVTTAQYDAYGDDVLTMVAYVIVNSNLSPPVSAQLHLVLRDIMGGISAVQGEHGELARPAGVSQIAEASNAYGQYFEHAGWQPIGMGR